MLRPSRVMVVDDDAETLALMHEIVAKEGFEVETAEDALGWSRMMIVNALAPYVTAIFASSAITSRSLHSAMSVPPATPASRSSWA